MKPLFAILLLIATTNNLISQNISNLSHNFPKNDITGISKAKIPLLNWRIVGPFRDTIKDISLLSSANPAIRLLTDTVCHQDTTVGTTNLNRILQKGKIVAYALCSVEAEKDRDVTIFINVDDAMRLWVNERIAIPALGFTRRSSVAKEIHLRKGLNKIIAEITDLGGEWGFDIAMRSRDTVQNSILPPHLTYDYYLSCRTPILKEGDSLFVMVSDTNYITVNNPARIEIYNAKNNLSFSGKIDIKKSEKLNISNLSPGAYRYNLFTDKDTMVEYFCYGPLPGIYDSSKISETSLLDKTAGNTLLPYTKRLQRLLADYSKWPSELLGKKIAYCIYKVNEIDLACQNKSKDYLFSAGLSLRSFTSVIDHGDEYYLLYVPERLKNIDAPMPLTVMVPYVTNSHPFYTGGILANYERITYISRFADKYGMAVLWPSSRIYKWYNHTPIVTKSIIETINDANKYYNIDKRHISLYGDCSGGLFAFQAAIRRPDLFSAIGVEGPELTSLEKSEAANSGLMTNNLFNLAENLYDKPLLILHSANDHKAPIEFSQRLMDSIKSNGGSVDYDNLGNVAKGGGEKKLYSEPETMGKIFTFFNSKRNINPSPVKRFSTYGLYNDTLYGVFVKEKLTPGKATVAYQVKSNRVEMTTKNVRALSIDLNKMGVTQTKEMDIFLNQKLYNTKHLLHKNNGSIIELTAGESENEKDEHFIKEVNGPANKVFLNTFAVVRPTLTNENITSVIAVLDSLWLDEYRNNILVIDEKQIDSAKKKGLNTIHIVNDMMQIDKKTLALAGIELKGKDTLVYNGEHLDPSDFSFAFYQKREDNTDNLYLGCTGPNIPIEMLKSIFIKSGWYDFELWDGFLPVIQGNYLYK